MKINETVNPAVQSYCSEEGVRRRDGVLKPSPVTLGFEPSSPGLSNQCPDRDTQKPGSGQFGTFLPQSSLANLAGSHNTKTPSVCSCFLWDLGLPPVADVKERRPGFKTHTGHMGFRTLDLGWLHLRWPHGKPSHWSLPSNTICSKEGVRRGGRVSNPWPQGY